MLKKIIKKITTHFKIMVEGTGIYLKETTEFFCWMVLALSIICFMCSKISVIALIISLILSLMTVVIVGKILM